MNVNVETTLNVSELESVRAKLLQLQETMNFLLQSIDPIFPVITPWPELLNKFNILVAKFINLHETATAPAFRKLYVLPGEPPRNPEYAHNLSIVLRTKLIPELEAAERDLLEEIQGSDLVNPCGLEDEAAVEQALRECNILVQRHDAFCSTAEEVLERLQGESQSNIYVDRNQETGEDEHVFADAVDSLGSTTPLNISPGETEERQQQQRDQLLNQTLAWMYSGPKGVPSNEENRKRGGKGKRI